MKSALAATGAGGRKSSSAVPPPPRVRAIGASLMWNLSLDGGDGALKHKLGKDVLERTFSRLAADGDAAVSGLAVHALGVLALSVPSKRAILKAGYVLLLAAGHLFHRQPR